MSPSLDPPSGSPDERLATLVHDLLSPLTVVTGFADVLETRGETLTPEQRATYTTLLAEGARELRTILDAARAQPQGGG